MKYMDVCLCVCESEREIESNKSLRHIVKLSALDFFLCVYV